MLVGLFSAPWKGSFTDDTLTATFAGASRYKSYPYEFDGTFEVTKDGG